LPFVREVPPAAMTYLRPVTLSEVLLLLSKMAANSSRLDVIPTVLLKKLSSSLAPYIVELANQSFATGSFPSEFKAAQITPILKKASLPPDVTASQYQI